MSDWFESKERKRLVTLLWVFGTIAFISYMLVAFALVLL
jgi:hypothetical protein